eukprot:scaffold3350_cov268-Pinguiococcus_pyrenoidosus.AAC.40
MECMTLAEVFYPHDTHWQALMELELASDERLVSVDELVAEEEEAILDLLPAPAQLDEVPLANEAARSIQDISADVQAPR